MFDKHEQSPSCGVVSYTYQGRPCKRCGETLRATRTRACIACNSKKKTREPLPTKGTYQGSPCGKCGGTERYHSNRACVACLRERDRIARTKRKEMLAEVLPYRTRNTDRCLGCGETKNYFFLDYCRDCVAAEKHRAPEKQTTFTRCDNCGEWKPYVFKGHCRSCVAAEQRRRIYWETQDKIKEWESHQRRYSDPF